jgi:hypothetical protein
MPSWAGQGGYHGFDTWQYGKYGPVGAIRGCWPTVERWFKFMSFVMNAMGVQEETHGGNDDDPGLVLVGEDVWDDEDGEVDEEGNPRITGAEVGAEQIKAE